MQKMMLIGFLCTLLGVVNMQPTPVAADAWWGKGARPAAWVLAHGGTIIHYSMPGKKDKKHKAMMLRGGQYVEVEFGASGTFDDAKNGTYEIVFYECDKSKGCEHQQFDKKTKIRGYDKVIGRTNVIARPGQTIFITINGGHAAVSYSGGAPTAKKTQQKKAPTVVVPPEPVGEFVYEGSTLDNACDPEARLAFYCDADAPSACTTFGQVHACEVPTAKQNTLPAGVVIVPYIGADHNGVLSQLLDPA